MANDQLGSYGLSSSEIMVDMIASMVGVFFQRVIMAPSYRVTLLTTVEGELVREGRLPPTGFGGLGACVLRIYKREGFSSFFRGFLQDAFLALFSAVMEEVSSAMVSGLLEFMVPSNRLQNMSVLAYVTMSLFSTSAAVLLASPVTGIHNTIVTNYVADVVAYSPVEDGEKIEEEGVEENGKVENKKGAYKYNSAREVAKDIYKRWGYRGFYFGFGLDAVAVFIYRGTYYYTLQFLSTAVHDRYPYAIARCLAVFAGCLTQPFEVVSRRMQLTASSSKNRYSNMIDCARTIVAEEGYCALWAGLRARLLVTCVGMAFVELRRIL